ncbi:hypothetical protein B0H19DRAFT_1072808 [Mycena capillaripes]|nr:hypothetical protein B0H19DRAFT_1072808 [Mycena capillaripes]
MSAWPAQHGVTPKIELLEDPPSQAACPATGSPAIPEVTVDVKFTRRGKGEENANTLGAEMYVVVAASAKKSLSKGCRWSGTATVRDAERNSVRNCLLRQPCEEDVVPELKIRVLRLIQNSFSVGIVQRLSFSKDEIGHAGRSEFRTGRARITVEIRKQESKKQQPNLYWDKKSKTREAW